MRTPQKSHWKDTMPKLQVCAWTGWRSTKSLCLQKRSLPLWKLQRRNLPLSMWFNGFKPKPCNSAFIERFACLLAVLISKMDVNRFLRILKIMKITIEVVFIEKSIVQAFFVKVKCSYSKICLIMWPFFTQKNIWMTSSNPLKISLTLLTYGHFFDCDDNKSLSKLDVSNPWIPQQLMTTDGSVSYFRQFSVSHQWTKIDWMKDT